MAKNTKIDYKLNELVFAQMKHFPPWPAMITEPIPRLGSEPSGGKHFCVVFFGTKDYAWMQASQIANYNADFMAKLLRQYKNKKTLVEACKDMEKYIETEDRSLIFPGEEAPSAFDKLIAETSLGTKKKSATSSTSKSTPSGKSETPKSSKETPKPSKETPKPSKKTPKSSKITQPSTSKDEPMVPSDDEKSRHSEKSEASEARTEEQPVTEVQEGSFEIFNVDHICELAEKQGVGKKYVPPPFEVAVPYKKVMKKNIQACNFTIGFIGLGQMGSRFAKCLLNTGHKLKLWNRTKSNLLEDFTVEGAENMYSPSELVQACDIIFCCLSDSDAVKNVVLSEADGILDCITGTKSYVELTSVNIETSIALSKAIKSKGGRYLELQPFGEASDIETNDLTLIAAGDVDVLEDCKSCINAMSKELVINDEVGSAIKFRLSLSINEIVRSFSLTRVARALKADGQSVEKFFSCLSLRKEMLCRSVVNHCMRMIKADYSGRKLKYIYSDLIIYLNMINKAEGNAPIAKFTKDEMKSFMTRGYGEKDIASLIEAIV